MLVLVVKPTVINNKFIETFFRLLEKVGMLQTKAMCINFFSILDFLSSPIFSMENSYCTEFYSLHMSKNGFSNGSKTDFKNSKLPIPKSQPNHLKELKSTTVVKEKKKRF